MNRPITLTILLVLLLTLPAIGQYQRCSGYLLRNVPANQSSLLADKARSDTINVLKYTVNLNITDFTNDSIWGSCDIRFTPQMNNITTLSLDLLQMNITSIVSGSNLSYSYDDTLVVVQLPTAMNIGDTATVTVWYNGDPQKDQSTWGGWYWYPNYAFNLGVGFAADPHNYGRVWHPCFDNFVERAQYEFNIITAGGMVSSCNGALINEVTINQDTIQRTWRLTEEIPSYLACVAVSDYTVVNQTHNGINGTIPIELYAREPDTVAMKNSFVNLGAAIDAFENNYGPYSWNKVGYTLVPFSSGAMEHATNIAYPRLAANGSLIYETLMAHELSHHWWGDLATCETAAEMWINEGLATYSESLFLEEVYGWQAYIGEIKANHQYVMRYPHNLEGGYLELDNIPHQHTYGDHVYKKGGDATHTLRGYLGDSLFKAGMNTFLSNNKFTDVNSIEMRDQLTTATGYDLTDFFDNWVLNPGFANFSIDSFEVSGSGPYNVTVYIHQKRTGAPNFFTNVPMEITCMDANWTGNTQRVSLSGEFSTPTLTVPFNPVYVTLNKDNLISHAVTDDQLVLKNTANLVLKGGLMTLIVENMPDSGFLRVEHNWAEPDPIKDISKKYELSPNRWWRLDGIMPAGYDLSGRFQYDGRTTSGNAGWLDNYLVGVTEDSVHLFYREGPHDDWDEYPWYTKNTLGNDTNAYGLMMVDSLILGEYVLANNKFNVHVPDNPIAEQDFLLYPNPNDGRMYLDYDLQEEEGLFTIYNLAGQLLQTHALKAGKNTIIIDATDLKTGTYVYSITNTKKLGSGKLMIVKR